MSKEDKKEKKQENKEEDYSQEIIKEYKPKKADNIEAK